MGWRFRKSINLGKGVRSNLNKKSAGISFGTKGARYSINSDGRKTATIGILGTGLYWTDSRKNSNKKENGCSGCLIWIVLIIVIVTVIYFVFK